MNLLNEFRSSCGILLFNEVLIEKALNLLKTREDNHETITEMQSILNETYQKIPKTTPVFLQSFRQIWGGVSALILLYTEPNTKIPPHPKTLKVPQTSTARFNHLMDDRWIQWLSLVPKPLFTLPVHLERLQRLPPSCPSCTSPWSSTRGWLYGHFCFDCEQIADIECNECCICLEEWSTSSARCVMLPKCRHIICNQCLVHIDKCPLCREEIYTC